GTQPSNLRYYSPALNLTCAGTTSYAHPPPLCPNASGCVVASDAARTKRGPLRLLAAARPADQRAGTYSSHTQHCIRDDAPTYDALSDNAGYSSSSPANRRLRHDHARPASTTGAPDTRVDSPRRAVPLSPGRTGVPKPRAPAAAPT